MGFLRQMQCIEAIGRKICWPLTRIRLVQLVGSRQVVPSLFQSRSDGCESAISTAGISRHSNSHGFFKSYGVEKVCSSRRSKSRVGFTLIELLVVISIIALLIAILLPVLSNARASALTIQCKSNLRQWAIAFHTYASDNKSTIPPYWFDQNSYITSQTSEVSWSRSLALLGYVSGSDVSADLYICPSNPEEAALNEVSGTYEARSYWYGKNFMLDWSYPDVSYSIGNELDKVSSPSDTFMIADAWAHGFTGYQPLYYSRLLRPHKRATSMAHVDGHVSLYEPVPVADDTDLDTRRAWWGR